MEPNQRRNAFLGLLSPYRPGFAPGQCGFSQIKESNIYHQLLKIGEDGITAEVEYEIEDDDLPVITKITAFNPGDRKIRHIIPVGALDLTQIEDMEERLMKHHGAVVQAMIGDDLTDDCE